MYGKCNECGKNMWTDEITPCSDKYFFVEIKDSKSISGIPVETWDDEKTLLGFYKICGS
ncbi:MAG: hypothetical protein OEL84_05695 [Nitrosopumilus sp.]|nr:hypothetical protein [Nitrosopumilus sp.]MDH3340761.1 hypothetical protein [Nitrosopumilus sp.]